MNLNIEDLLYQIHYSTSANLSVLEGLMLIALGLITLYITLLRRAPGYSENIRLHLKLWTDAGLWAGNLLNLALYVPFGWTSQRWKHSGKKTIIAAFVLSAACEALQYLTSRGTADINDIMFNTLGAAMGVWLAEKTA